jgi:hypothetical protein
MKSMSFDSYNFNFVQNHSQYHPIGSARKCSKSIFVYPDPAFKPWWTQQKDFCRSLTLFCKGISYTAHLAVLNLQTLPCPLVDNSTSLNTLIIITNSSQSASWFIQNSGNVHNRSQSFSNLYTGWSTCRSSTQGSRLGGGELVVRRGGFGRSLGSKRSLGEEVVPLVPSFNPRVPFKQL